MNPLEGQYEIKSVLDFEASMAKGEAYEGLVEDIGYVYWRKEAMYFIRMNSDEWYAKPVYQKVPGPYFTLGGRKVITQTAQRLYIMPKEELMQHDYGRYYQFYVLPGELRKQTCETDAIQPKKVSQGKIKAESEKDEIKREVDKVDDILGIVDNVIGFLEDAGKIKIPKWVPKAKAGVTGVFMAVDCYLQGDYVDATGRLLEALNPYGVWIDIGTVVYNSDLMQRRMAEQYAKDWKKYNALYEDGCRRSPNSTKTKEYERLKDYNMKRFMECMDQLGCKY